MELYTVKEMAARRRIAYHRLLEWVKEGWVQGVRKDPSNVRSQQMLTDELMDAGLARVAHETSKGRRDRKELREQLGVESGDAFLAQLSGRTRSRSSIKKAP